MPEEYTDQDIQIVTQLAYMDFTTDMYGMTIGEILSDEQYADPLKKSLYE